VPKTFNHGYKEILFSDQEQQIETAGIRSLLNALIEEIEQAKMADEEVVINTTPGFKLESAYSTIIGMVYQVPVKYIYELFRRVVTLTPIPIHWDSSLFFTYESFFLWITEDYRFKKLWINV
jgi:hypothetical protein